MSSKKKALDIYLLETYKQFIAIKDKDFKKSQEVFKGVFGNVKEMMGEQCSFFKKYGCQVLYGGSVYDGIKVSRLDEFDMDIVIRLPICYEDGENGIYIENDKPGFIKMRITRPFDYLDKQPHWEQCHKVTREWRDTEKYFSQKKFRQWMHGVVQKAINKLNGKVDINGTTYLLTYKESGPAFTLNIVNDEGNEPFKLDVDLVPVIRFQLPRWPQGYRAIKRSQVKDWLVVPKPNKLVQDEAVKNRCWRLSFQEFERELIKGCQQLKTTIRLIKKLRDSLGFRCIASYYIKTLFLWKVHKVNDPKFWQQKISVLFRIMLVELYEAIKNKNIPYFWQEKNNLIESLKPTHQRLYEKQLSDVLNCIDSNFAERLVSFILSKKEFEEFKMCDFYEKQISLLNESQTFISSELQSDLKPDETTTKSLKGSIDASVVENLMEPVMQKLMTSLMETVMKSLSGDLANKLEDMIEPLVIKVEHLEKNVKKLELSIVYDINNKIDILDRANKVISSRLEKLEDFITSTTKAQKEMTRLIMKNFEINKTLTEDVTEKIYKFECFKQKFSPNSVDINDLDKKINEINIKLKNEVEVTREKIASLTSSVAELEDQIKGSNSNAHMKTNESKSINHECSCETFGVKYSFCETQPTSTLVGNNDKDVLLAKNILNKKKRRTKKVTDKGEVSEIFHTESNEICADVFTEELDVTPKSSEKNKIREENEEGSEKQFRAKVMKEEE